jgi:putative transposase
MQMVLQGARARRVKKITTELCGREFSRQTTGNLTEKLDEQVQAWAERPLEEEYPFLLADAMQLNILPLRSPAISDGSCRPRDQ